MKIASPNILRNVLKQQTLSENYGGANMVHCISESLNDYKTGDTKNKHTNKQ